MSARSSGMLKTIPLTPQLSEDTENPMMAQVFPDQEPISTDFTYWESDQLYHFVTPLGQFAFGVSIPLTDPPAKHPGSIPFHIQSFWHTCVIIEKYGYHAGLHRREYDGFLLNTLDQLHAVSVVIPLGPALAGECAKIMASALTNLACRQQRHRPREGMIALKGGVEPNEPTMVSPTMTMTNILRQPCIYPVSG